ncbi:MAG: histidine phosphatase family protein [Clostridia bacterium]|nr:histidine phosphatase family protein [Clostridia bacterium]
MKQRTIYFFRHGATGGNLEKRYIGRTDEALLPESVELIQRKVFPKTDVIFTSPLKRCIQTTEIAYPGKPYLVVEDLRECDFGEFEGRNYFELSQNPDYQKWIDSNGVMPFPQGETPALFKQRSIQAFLTCAEQLKEDASATFIVHNGTIMSVFEALAKEKKTYYEWSVDHVCGYSCVFDHICLKHISRLEL